MWSSPSPNSLKDIFEVLDVLQKTFLKILDDLQEFSLKILDIFQNVSLKVFNFQKISSKVLDGQLVFEDKSLYYYFHCTIFIYLFWC